MAGDFASAVFRAAEQHRASMERASERVLLVPKLLP